MRITRLDIENFRRIEKATINFAPSSFIVGPNNTAKSSIIVALEALLSLEKEKLTQQDILERADGSRANTTTITAYFGEIPSDVAASRGFRGRVVNGEYLYRKSLTTATTKPKIETQEYSSKIKPNFKEAKKVSDLIQGGLSFDIVQEALGLTNLDDTLPRNWQKSLPEVLDFDTSAPALWVENPGGIPQNVLSRLPRLIHIPSLADTKEIESAEQKYALGECLSLLFEDLIAATPLASEIQTKLTELEHQMDPHAETSLIHGLVTDVNSIISDVFPKCGISIEPSLQQLLDILRPKYEVKVFSNISTVAARQGTGLIRTCAFAMLRYHAKLKIKKDLQTRPIVVAFEEPELFLHPAAANLLRDTIYSLGLSDQIICTTHSPWMIDMSQNPQSVTCMRIGTSGFAEAWNYGVSSALGKLPEDHKQRVRMLQLFDDELSRVFFADRIVIVEGDSEVLAIKQTLLLLPEKDRKDILSHYQIVKARGKASIISLVKYLRELGMEPMIMHDGDFGTAGAEKFNKPIAEAARDPKKIVVLNRNLEEAMGYVPPNSDKPYEAFFHASAWSTGDSIPTTWRSVIEKLFDYKW